MPTRANPRAVASRWPRRCCAASSPPTGPCAGHPTPALYVNENEPRLLEDLRRFLTRLAPPGVGYLHDDIELRDCPPDEPRNAHSHLAAILLNSTEVVPVAGGRLVLGTWQSLLLAELDGPRDRTVRVQLLGEREPPPG